MCATFTRSEDVAGGERPRARGTTCRSRSIFAARSAAGSFCSWTTSHSGRCLQSRSSGIAGPTGKRAIALRGVSQPAQFPRRHHPVAALRRRAGLLRRRLGAEHHAEGARRLHRRTTSPYLLETGQTLKDSVGGGMVAVIRNTSQLTDADRKAMAAYLKSLPPVEGPPRPARK